MCIQLAGAVRKKKTCSASPVVFWSPDITAFECPVPQCYGKGLDSALPSLKKLVYPKPNSSLGISWDSDAIGQGCQDQSVKKIN